MTAFWKKEEDKINNSKAVKKSADLVKSEKKGSKSKKSSKKDKGLIIPEDKANLINKVLIKPMISEAVMNAQELGKYTFQVRKPATKNEIALAIEALYKVSVKKVNVMNYKAKAKFFRGKKGSTKGYKKAIITLVEGDKIKLFS
jgi:large subunit ribosomal protein L23